MNSAQVAGSVRRLTTLETTPNLGSFCSPRIFSVLSAILYLGNVTYKKRATGRDEGLEVGPPEVLDTLSQLLKVHLPALGHSGQRTHRTSFLHGPHFYKPGRLCLLPPHNLCNTSSLVLFFSLFFF